MTEHATTGRRQGEIRSAISDGIVGLLKEFYGAGPTQAKTYLIDDLVVCVLRDGFTRAERTLLQAGRGHAVAAQRLEFQEVMREQFVAVVERTTGRRVVGFMPGSQEDPGMLSQVFILADEQTGARGTDRVGPARAGSRPAS